jgi:probable lipoprotein LpqN
MRNLTTVATAGIAAFALSMGTVACSSSSHTTTTTSASSTPTKSAAATTTSAKATTAAPSASGANYTIADYIKDNQIEEATIHHGDPGSPTIDLPVPDGWSKVPESDAAPYGGIVYDQPTNPNDPPTIVAIVSKLSGNVDAAKILEYASGEIKNLDGYEPLGNGGSTGTLGGFQAYQIGGNYVKAANQRAIAQKTVVIPGQDGLFVLQLNADSPVDQMDALMTATNVIDDQTTITP